MKKTSTLQTFLATSITSTDNRILASTTKEKVDDVEVNPVFTEPDANDFDRDGQSLTGNRIAESGTVEKTTAELETEPELYGFGRNGN